MTDELKFYRTVLKVTVISDRHIGEEEDLAGIAEEMISGDFSGNVETETVDVLSPREAAEALEAQGSDASFLLAGLVNFEDTNYFRVTIRSETNPIYVPLPLVKDFDIGDYDFTYTDRQDWEDAIQCYCVDKKNAWTKAFTKWTLLPVEEILEIDLDNEYDENGTPHDRSELDDTIANWNFQ